MSLSVSFDHIQLNARDVEATASFYERVFGMRRIRASEADGIPFVHLDADGVRLSINGQPPRAVGQGNGVDHIALRVSDLDEAMVRLRAMGVELLGEAGRSGSTAYVFVQAPDGMVVELVSHGRDG